MKKQLTNYVSPQVKAVDTLLSVDICQSPVNQCTGIFSFSEGGIDDDEPDV